MTHRLIALLLCVFIAQAVSSQNLKLMTYNIRLDVASDGENSWNNRKDFFTGQIQFYEPDILGLQEVKPNQLLDLKNALTGYAVIGKERDGDGKGESSNIFYKKDVFQLIKEHTFWLSETPDTVSKGWDAAINRVCTYGLFKHKKNNKLFWAFNTHLDHIGEQARTKSIQLILSKITQLNTKKYPVFFMGDFNSEPTTARIIGLKKVMDDARDISIQKPFGPEGTFNNFKFCEPVKTLIDYIFISRTPGIKVLKYAILSDAKNLKYPSDHLPVFVQLQLK